MEQRGELICGQKWLGVGTEHASKSADWALAQPVWPARAALAILNEIEADKSGTVTRVMVDNGQAVEYGQPLFMIE